MLRSSFRPLTSGFSVDLVGVEGLVIEEERMFGTFSKAGELGFYDAVGRLFGGVRHDLFEGVLSRVEAYVSGVAICS